MKQEKIMIKKLKEILNDRSKVDSSILNVLEISDVFSDKSKKCKLCNKSFSGNNKAYGTSCLKNLYDKSSIDYFKEIDDKELFLYTSIAFKLKKENLNQKQITNICESYLSKLYIEKIDNIQKLPKELDKCIGNSKKIMKLNTAYRVSNIIKRNKKIIDMDKVDIIIDEKLLKFFRTYFSISKITNPGYYEVYYYMQYILWELVVKGGEFNNLKLSSKCLSHSLSVLGLKPNDIKFTDKDKYVINLIKKEEGFRNKVKRLIKKYCKRNEITFNDSTPKDKKELYYSFDTRDLFYSLHSVKINFKGVRIDDKYKDKNKQYLTLGNVLNDFAAISSQYGVIKPYKITINFKWSGFDA